MTANERSFKKGASGNPGTQFKPGADPRRNPGGRPPGYLKTLHEVTSIEDWRAICVKAIEDAKAGDRYARTWIGDYLLGKPKESIDVTSNADPAQLALLAALRMTPHERRAEQARLYAEDMVALDTAHDDADEDPTE
jgi:hypothetical protein